MDDARGMRCVHCRCRLSKPANRVPVSDPAGAQPLVDAAAALVLHNDVRTFVPASDVVDGDDVRVPAEPSGEDRLPHEALGYRRVCTELGREHLDGDLTVELEVVSEEHFGGRAATEHPHKPIARWKACRHGGSLARESRRRRRSA